MGKNKLAKMLQNYAHALTALEYFSDDKKKTMFTQLVTPSNKLCEPHNLAQSKILYLIFDAVRETFSEAGHLQSDWGTLEKEVQNQSWE